jgi:para-nitrobenzyl esterase
MLTAVQANVSGGVVEGAILPGSSTRVFRGIPYAAPPVGNLRWRPPQPVAAWDGVRPAGEFGPRAVQPAIFPDMTFLDKEASEDCLYLNVWTPACPSWFFSTEAVLPPAPAPNHATAERIWRGRA